MTLYIHSHTEHQLEQLLNVMPQALLLTGAPGSGLSTVGQLYANRTGRAVVTVLPEKDEKVDLEKGTIPIERIRRLYDVTKTIEPQGRVVIIDDAERMAIPAQNAFLKLLEEPTSGTHFMLLTHKPELLLPTILSRSQRIDVRPITPQQSEALLNEKQVTDPRKRAQLLFIAAGYPAELSRLIEVDNYFESRATIIKDARLLISGSSYEKLLIAKKYKDSREHALTLLEDAMKLSRRTLVDNPEPALLILLQRYETIHRRITEQGNVRLQLSTAIGV